MSNVEANVAVRDYTKERDERCQPVAREIALLLGTKAVMFPMGSSESTEKKIEVYSDFVQDTILPLLEKYDVRIDEIGYIMSLMLEMVQQTFDRVQPTIEMAYESANAHMWGVEDGAEITIGLVTKALEEKQASRKAAGAVQSEALQTNATDMEPEEQEVVDAVEETEEAAVEEEAADEVAADEDEE